LGKAYTYLREMHRRKLEALQFANPSQFNVRDPLQLRRLILWIEESKIRFYPPDKRQGLRDIGSAGWEQAFLKYLGDLQCPRQFKQAMNEQEVNLIVDWLLGIAVSTEYADNSKEYNKIGATVAKVEDKPVTIHASTASSPLSCQSQEAFTLASELAAIFQIPVAPAMAGESTDERVAHILRLISRRIQKTVAVNKKKGKPKAAPTEQKYDQAADKARALKLLDSYPLGFSTGDPQIDQAAKILRLLHLQDIRELQTLINEVIVSVQEFTADPKTDARLGKVGVS